MISLFELILDDINFNHEGDTQIACPFPHSDLNGNLYYEENPSAGINIDKGVFNCFSCSRKFSELGFTAELLGITYKQASELKRTLNTKSNLVNWTETGIQNLKQNPGVVNKIKQLGITEKVIEELNLGTIKDNSIDFPVLIYNQMVDRVQYRPNETPKVKREFGSPSGMVIPFDIWRLTQPQVPTIICAGEKDMAIARSYGLNAITITGGEGALPSLFGSFFKNRNVYIAYDNDDAGRSGAQKVAMFLKPYAALIKIIDLSPICVEKGEDLWDFFKKYNKTGRDFINIVKDSPEFDEKDFQIVKEQEYPTITLMEAGTPKYLNKIVRSNVQVASSFEEQFQAPTVIEATKTRSSENPERDIIARGEKRNWFLDHFNIQDLLFLIDNKLKQNTIENHKRELLRIPLNEKYIVIKDHVKETVHKSIITDILPSEDEIMNAVPRAEILAYSLGKRLETGKKYKITYKIVPNPMDGQKLTAIILDLESSDDEMESFEMTPKVIDHLKLFQNSGTTLLEKIQDNVDRVQGMVNAKYNEKLIKLIDIWYHSVLFINVGPFQNVKGAIDVLLIGESRTGKSSTAETLAQWYGKGKKVSLITTTKTALIGGTHRTTGGSNQTRSGIIPMNHGGALILEELGKSRDNEILKELTEIKSSGIARIGRVSGTIELPAIVRFLTITNPKTVSGSPKPITSYPNGISIVTELVGAAEDIARFDIAAIFADMASGDLDPYATFKSPHPKEAYRDKINWVWSRKASQIIIDQETYVYLIEKSNLLKNTYDSHIKIFGTETWKKIIRFAVAVAAYVVSTDASFQNIIVKPEHIDFAAEYIVSLYDNEVFRLKEYVEEEKRYRVIDEEGVQTLKDYFAISPLIIQELERSSQTTRANLDSVSGGMTREDLNGFISRLRVSSFIQLEGFNIIPTERFRKGMKKISSAQRENLLGKAVGPLNVSME